MTEELLTIDDIAALYKCSRVYARDKLVKRPGFPRPSLALSQKMKRWMRGDVLTLSRISRHKDLRILSNTYYRATAEEIAASL